MIITPILPSCLPILNRSVVVLFSPCLFMFFFDISSIGLLLLPLKAKMSIMINVWNLVNQTGLTILLSGHQVHFFFFKTNIFQNFIISMIPYESLIMYSFHTFNTDFFSQYTFPFPKHYKVQAFRLS